MTSYNKSKIQTDESNRLLEVEKEMEEIRIERLNLWNQEDVIKARHEYLQRKNAELFTEYLKLKGIVAQ